VGGFEVTDQNAVFGDIALPAMLLKEPALENNLSVMAAYAADHGFLLAPHGKTTMAPQLFRRQLEAGAWAITVANMAQAAVAYGAGAARVLVANEIVSLPDAQAVVDSLAASERELYVLVDSVPGVELLDRNLSVAGFDDRLRVLVELGVPGGRTGARTEDEAAAVGKAVGTADHLRLVGVECFEGLLAADRSPEALANVDNFLDRLRSLAVRLADENAFSGNGPIIVSAGGSRYFDRVALLLGRDADYRGHDVQLVTRSGCYLVHDHGTYASASPLAEADQEGRKLVGALEVWADVLSVPEPGLVIVGLGKRDVSYDIGLPVPLHIVHGNDRRVEPLKGGTLDNLNDQHGFLRIDDQRAGIHVGDRVGFGLSHPCTAFDKWRMVLLVSDDYQIREQITTWFH
jgi:D-serine dehydratase